VVLRLLQGIASGGEWGGGVLMISESAPPEKKRGFYAAWSQLGVGCRLCALVCRISCRANTSRETNLWLGDGDCPFLQASRSSHRVTSGKAFSESQELCQVKKSGKTAELPIVEVIRRHPRESFWHGFCALQNGGATLFLAFASCTENLSVFRIGHVICRDAGMIVEFSPC